MAGWTVVPNLESAWKPVVPAGQPVAGAGDMGTPQPAAHPAVNMQSAVTPGLVGSRLLQNAEGLAKPLLNPVKSILSYPGFVDPSKQGGPIQTIANDPDKGEGISNAIADTGTSLAAGKALQRLGSIDPSASLLRGGQALQDAGSTVINSKFSPTMKEAIRGNNPGRGILESGIGPTLNKGVLANKVNSAITSTGQKIGNAVQAADYNPSAPPILSSDVAPRLTEPINEAIGRLNGPFGTASTEPFETMRGKLGNTAPGATKPIFGPDAPTEILPSDLWKHIQNLDQNTRFNTDPEVESVNETRRDVRQGLRPMLESVDPSIQPNSRTYSDLLSAENAIDRTQGGFGVPKGLSSLVDSTLKGTLPVTTAATGLFKLGGGLKGLGGRLPSTPLIDSSQFLFSKK